MVRFPQLRGRDAVAVAVCGGALAACPASVVIDRTAASEKTAGASGFGGSGGSSASASSASATGGPTPQCHLDADCPSLPSACQVATCQSEQCVATNLVEGAVLPPELQKPGTCKTLQCDGSGKAVSVADDTNVPGGTECAQGMCAAGVPSFANAPVGKKCSQGHCDGYGGCFESCALEWTASFPGDSFQNKGTASIEANTVGVDSTGAAVVAGVSVGTFKFGGKELGTWEYAKINSTHYWTFVAKVNSGGTPMWGTNVDCNQGNLPTCRESWPKTLTISTADRIIFSSDYYGDSLVSFSADGSSHWSQEAYGPFGLDANGNIYTKVVYGPPQYGLGIAKFDDSGLQIWKKKYFTPDQDYLAYRGALKGYYAWNANTGPDTDLLITAFNSSGYEVWSKSFPGSSGQAARLASDAQDNLFVATSAKGPIDFGGGTLSPLGTLDLVVAKLDPTGKHIWSKRFAVDNTPYYGVAYGTPKYALNGPSALAVTGLGDIVVQTSFTDHADLGGQKLAGPLPAEKRCVFAKLTGTGGDHICQVQTCYARPAAGPKGEIVVATDWSSLDLGNGPICPSVANGHCLAIAKFAP